MPFLPVRLWQKDKITRPILVHELGCCSGSSGVFHDVDSATLQVAHRCTPAPYGMLDVLPTSSHTVFSHDVAWSYGLVVTSVYGLVATSACHHDKTCTPCNQSCQWDVDLVGSFDQNMELFLWQSDTHNFQICMQKHLFFRWNIRVGKFLSKALFAAFCPLFVVEFRWRNVVYHWATQFDHVTWEHMSTLSTNISFTSILARQTCKLKRVQANNWRPLWKS